MHEGKLRKILAEISLNRSQLEEIKDEASDAFENKPDTWKESDKGLDYEAKLEELGEAIAFLENAETNLETAIKD